MSFDTDFLSLMSDVIEVAPVDSVDKFGARTYGDAVQYACRIVYGEVLRQQVDQKMTLGNITVWVAPHSTSGVPTDITPESLVTLPDGTTPTINSIERYSDEDGSAQHHWKLVLG